MKIFQEGLTFEDVLLLPEYSDILPHEVDIKTNITKDIKINIPIISSAMDTITEYEMAIEMAQNGGLGIIHKNMSIDQQILQISKVKNFRNDIILNPIVTTSNVNILIIYNLIKKHNFYCFPVVNDNKQLIGLITRKNIFSVSKKSNMYVQDIMIKKDDLITITEEEYKKYSIKDLLFILEKNNIEKLLVIKNNFILTGLITKRKILSCINNKLACIDSNNKLRVGAAVSIGKDSYQRIESLIENDTDIIVIDTAHGHSKSVIELIKWTKNKFPYSQIIGGNIATKDAAIDLYKNKVDGIKIGMGPGSICTTRIISGVGVPQITAISNAAEGINYDIPIIADGGIKFSGDIVKSIAAGASSVMIGSILAGAKESPGKIIKKNKKVYKYYRGMGSLAAMKYGSKDRYFQEFQKDNNKLIPEGIESIVPYQGKLEKILYNLIGGIKSGMGYTGCQNIRIMQKKSRFVKISNASFRESHIHSVNMIKDNPNYKI